LAVVVAGLVVFVAVIAIGKFGYHGVANSENVEVVQTLTIAPNRTAMLVRRSDHAALSGDTYFVLVGDRPYSVPELRKRLYAIPAVFKVGRGGLSIHWSSPNELVVECINCGITKDIIETRKFSQEDVAIRYVDFP
jgi:hypothetical protein